MSGEPTFWNRAISIDDLRSSYAKHAILNHMWPLDHVESCFARSPFGVHPLARFGPELLTSIDANLGALYSRCPAVVDGILGEYGAATNPDPNSFWSALAEFQVADCLVRSGCELRPRERDGPDFYVEGEGRDFVVEVKTFAQRYRRLHELREVEHFLAKESARARLGIDLPMQVRIRISRRHFWTTHPRDCLQEDADVFRVAEALLKELRDPRVVELALEHHDVELSLDVPGCSMDDLEFRLENSSQLYRGRSNAHGDDHVYLAGEFRRLASKMNSRRWRKQLATGKPTILVAHSTRAMETDTAIAGNLRTLGVSSQSVGRVGWPALIASWETHGRLDGNEEVVADLIKDMRRLAGDQSAVDLEGVLLVIQSIDARNPFRGIWVRSRNANEQLESAIQELLTTEHDRRRRGLVGLDGQPLDPR